MYTMLIIDNNENSDFNNTSYCLRAQTYFETEDSVQDSTED